MGTPDYLMRYSASCTQLAANYIERSTRFNVKDLRIVDTRPMVRQFIIKIRHELEVVAEARDLQGKHQPGSNDFATVDWQWYQEQVAVQTQSEFARPETLDSLITSVKSQEYAKLSERTCIRTHPRRFFHTYTCDGCGGAGKISCHNCAGCGQVSCNHCHGSGRTSCHSCHGSGTTTTHRTVRDHNGYTRSETQTRSCHSCSGGRVRCSWCGGSGKNRCGTCGGTGRLTCATCAGHGCLTKITSTHTYTLPRFSGHYPEGTPEYVHAALCKAGFAHLAGHGDITLQEVVPDREKSAVEFVYECTMPFCELTVEVVGHRSAWVLFGNEPQIFDAGGVLEVLLTDDFEQLRASSISKRRWLPWFHASAGKAMTPFLASELNQEIIQANSAGLAPKVIVEQVNRSVSETYIQNTLDALHRSVKVAAYWSRIKWMLALALLSIPFALLATAWLHHGERTGFTPPAAQVFLSSANPFGIAWQMGFLTMPFTLAGCWIARWASTRWLRKAGGKMAVTWAERRGLLLGKWTALAMITAAVGMAGAVFNRWPLWIDSEGKAYGRLALFDAPEAIAPVRTPMQPRTHAAEKKRPKKTARKPAQKPTHTSTPELDTGAESEPVPPPMPAQAPEREPEHVGPWIPTG